MTKIDETLSLAAGSIPARDDARRSFVQTAVCSRSSQSGSMILALFGAIAMLGVVSVGLNTVMRGPVAGMADVTKRSVAENNMMASSKLAVTMAPTAQASNGDCDGDGYVEPFPYRDAGSGPKPTGGGYIPSSFGASLADPWQTQYGYCSWDPGPKSVPDNVAACGGTGALRLKGAPNNSQIIIAVISAGKDRTFQTACNAYVDANADNIPDTPLVNKPAASDDIVMTYTYSEANNATGSSLWALKAGSPTTATITKDLEITGNTTLSGTLRLGGGLVLPGDPGNDSITGGCNAANDQQLRRNTSTNPPKLEICNFAGGATVWQSVSGASGDNLGNHIATQALSMGGNRIGGLATPTLSTDAATRDIADLGMVKAAADAGKENTLWGWGTNGNGQVGDGTTTNRLGPVKNSIPTDWVQISAGWYYNCAIKLDGTLWCWGYNGSGRFGNGGYTSTTSPVQIGTENTWDQISAGPENTCAIKKNGTLWCWGNGGSGQLGYGGTSSQPSPVQAGGATNWATVAAGGSSQNCAVRTDGTLWCWGNNSHGELGDGTTNNRSSPGQVGSATNWKQAALGYDHTCALRTDGTIWCWGGNYNGQLGIGSTSDNYSPQKVGSDTDWTQLDAGYNHVCAVKANGTLWCWGWNGYGQLGDGTTTQRASPVQIGTATDWINVGLGRYHTCALKTDGSVWCWGTNGSGELGDGTTTQQNSPVKVNSTLTFTQISVGMNHAIGIQRSLADDTRKLDKTGGTMTGQLALPAPTAANHVSNKNYIDTIVATYGSPQTLWGIGYNAYYVLGDGTSTNSAVWKQSEPSIRWLQLTGGCGIRFGGTLWCWGNNQYGRVGDGTTLNRLSPVQVGIATDWQSVSSGGATCAIKTNGTLWCWGYNDYGSVGDGTTTHRYSPVQIGSATNWMSVSARGSQSCGIRTDGTLWCWGGNNFGQVGDGTTTNRLTPYQVTSATNWMQVSTSNQTAALKTDGTLWYWGYNGVGEAGDGSAGGTYYTTPRQIGSATWRKIVAGNSNTCGLKTDGTIACTGLNGQGQIGDGTTTGRYVFTQAGTATDWVDVSIGGSYAGGVTCGIKADRSLWCWGDNTFGQFGDGTTTRRLVPGRVGSGNNWLQVLAGGGMIGLRSEAKPMSD